MILKLFAGLGVLVFLFGVGAGGLVLIDRNATVDKWLVGAMLFVALVWIMVKVGNAIDEYDEWKREKR